MLNKKCEWYSVIEDQWRPAILHGNKPSIKREETGKQCKEAGTGLRKIDNICGSMYDDIQHSKQLTVCQSFYEAHALGTYVRFLHAFDLTKCYRCYSFPLLN